MLIDILIIKNEVNNFLCFNRLHSVLGFVDKIGVYSKDMEKNNQEQSPKVTSIVEQQKAEASKYVANRIDAFQQEQGVSVLDAARKVYEEVKGNSYREEQAVSKLLEFLQMQNEVSLRGSEIINSYTELRRYVSPSTTSVNEDKFLLKKTA